MRAFFVGMAVLWTLVSISLGGRSHAEEGLARRDAQGLVTVVVTLMPPFAPGGAIKVKIALDTHSVALDGVAFDEAVTMRTPDGAEVRPSAVEQASGGGHHRQAVLAFPPLSQPGAVRIVVRNVGGVAERTFAWERFPR
jgi:hypothetical protein